MTGRYPPSPAEQERSAQRWAARVSLLVFALGVLCIAAQYAIAALVPGPSQAVAVSSLVLFLLAPVTLGIVGATLALVAQHWLRVALNSLLACAPITIYGLASLLAR